MPSQHRTAERAMNDRANEAVKATWESVKGEHGWVQLPGETAGEMERRYRAQRDQRRNGGSPDDRRP